MWIHEGMDRNHPLTALCRKFGLETRVCTFGPSMAIHPCDDLLKLDSKSNDFSNHFGEYDKVGIKK
jgi:hypothetical protein